MLAALCFSAESWAIPIMPSSPLAHYLFDGNTDDAGGLHNGVASGSPSFVADTPFSYGGNLAIDLDGLSDVVTVADAAALRPGTGAWTLSIWFQAADADQVGALIVKREPSVPFNQLGMSVAGDIQFGTPGQNLGLVDVFDSSTNKYVARTTADVLDGTWHHAALVKTATTSNPLLYLDGSLVTSLTIEANVGTPPRDINNTDDWVIGGIAGATTARFDGLIDEAAMWDTALSADNVEWLFQNSVVPEPTTALLLATGLAGLAVRGRRRR